MIKYNPSLPPENNVTSFKKNIFGHRLFLFLLMAGILIYSLWLICIPVFNSYVLSHKKQFNDAFSGKFTGKGFSCYPSKDPNLVRLQGTLDKLQASILKKNNEEKIQICITNIIKKPNAFASMGRHIAVTVEMLKLVKHEEEMAIILGHELGHIYNEDVYKYLGNAIFNNIIYIAMKLVTDSSFNFPDMLNSIIQFNDMHYSREQEYKADAFGLELLMKNFKNYELGIKFYEKAMKDSNFGSMEIFYSHPDIQNRVNKLRELASKQSKIKDK